MNFEAECSMHECVRYGVCYAEANGHPEKCPKQKPIRAGTLRGKQTDGKWIVAEPGSYLYSTVSMIAEEMWDGTQWKKIHDDDTDSSSD